MKHNFSKKIALASVLIALAVVGGTLSLPVLGAKCAPVQHMVNVIAGILLGPVYSVGIAFLASLIRVMMGVGSILAFSGSIFGGFLAGLSYKLWKKEQFAFLGELIGTGVIGGISSYPIAKYLMGNEVAVFAFVIPFTISSTAGVILGFICLSTLKASGLLVQWQEISSI
ncbi:MAG: energy coupling factor transporter S component ThiW [Eubacteriales bacterium]